MRKNFVYVLALVLSVISCSEKPDFHDELFGGLSGNVLSVKTNLYSGEIKAGGVLFAKKTLNRVIEYKYDIDGYLIEESQYDANGILTEQTICEYEDGHLASKVKTDGQNVIKEEKLIRKKGRYYLWDVTENGETQHVKKDFSQAVVIVSTMDDVPVEMWFYTPSGRLKESWRFKNGTLKSQLINEYDDKGNKVKIINKNNDTITETYTLEYSNFDEMGNWTVQTAQSSYLPYQIISEREITYR